MCAKICKKTHCYSSKTVGSFFRTRCICLAHFIYQLFLGRDVYVIEYFKKGYIVQ